MIIISIQIKYYNSFGFLQNADNEKIVFYFVALSLEVHQNTFQRNCVNIQMLVHLMLTLRKTFSPQSFNLQNDD